MNPPVDPARPPSASPAWPPQVADHDLLRCIGRGGYGEVWLARNVLGSFRAIKFIHRARFDSERPYEREFNGILKYEPVSREHPGHVDVLQVGRQDAGGYFYYVMELADDAGTGRPWTGSQPAEAYVPRTLKTEFRQRGRLPVAEVIDLGIALTHALDHLHRCGLVHRDLKPANVIFVEGRPQLADIGLVTGAAESATALGTEGFLPAEGAGTPQADLYGLGKVMYEMATGLDRQRYPELPPEIGDWADRPALLELLQVINRACAVRPADRYPTAGRMLADLEVLRDGRSLRALARRRRAGFAVALTVLLALLSAAFVWRPWLRRAPSGVPEAGAPTTVVPEAALNGAVAGKPGWSTNALALAAYFNGRAQLRRGGDEAGGTQYLARAILEFQRAAGLDTNLVLAVVGEAECYHELDANTGFRPPDTRERARELAERALAMNPGVPEAHVVLGVYQMRYQWDWIHSSQSFHRALALDPACGPAHRELAAWLTLHGRHHEAVRLAVRARELQPGDLGADRQYMNSCWAAGLTNEAIALAVDLANRHPGSSRVVVESLRLLGTLNRGGEFQEVLDGHRVTLKRTAAMRAEWKAALAQTGPAGIWTRHLARNRRGMNPMWMMYYEMAVGNVDDAFMMADQLLDERQSFLLFVRVLPCWAPLWRDPRFEPLCRRMGLPPVPLPVVP